MVEAFERLASKKGCTPAQLCLAWVLAQGEDFIPIPGTKKSKYLRENWESLKIKLTQAELDEIRQDIKEIPIEGSQY